MTRLEALEAHTEKGGRGSRSTQIGETRQAGRARKHTWGCASNTYIDIGETKAV